MGGGIVVQSDDDRIVTQTGRSARQERCDPKTVITLIVRFKHKLMKSTGIPKRAAFLCSMARCVQSPLKELHQGLCVSAEMEKSWRSTWRVCRSTHDAGLLHSCPSPRGHWIMDQGIPSSISSLSRNKKQCRDTVGAMSPISWFGERCLENMTTPYL